MKIKEADITRFGTKLLADGKPLKKLEIKDVIDNIVIFREDKGNFLFSAGTTWGYFMDSSDSAQKLKNGEYEMLMFPWAPRFNFDINVIEDIWKKKHTNKVKGGEHVLAIWTGETNEQEIFLDKISVRKGYRQNSIASKLFDLLRQEYPNAKVTVTGTTKDGTEFLSKYAKVDKNQIKRDGQTEKGEDGKSHEANNKFDKNMKFIGNKKETEMTESTKLKHMINLLEQYSGKKVTLAEMANTDIGVKAFLKKYKESNTIEQMNFRKYITGDANSSYEDMVNTIGEMGYEDMNELLENFKISKGLNEDFSAEGNENLTDKQKNAIEYAGTKGYSFVGMGVMFDQITANLTNGTDEIEVFPDGTDFQGLTIKKAIEGYWVDPAGGIHAPGEDDPAAMYESKSYMEEEYQYEDDNLSVIDRPETMTSEEAQEKWNDLYDEIKSEEGGVDDAINQLRIEQGLDDSITDETDKRFFTIYGKFVWEFPKGGKSDKMYESLDSSIKKILKESKMLNESYKVGNNITYNKLGNQSSGKIQEILPNDKYLVMDGRKEVLVRETEITGLVPKEKQTRKAGIPYKRIEQWEEKLSELEQERKDIELDQEYEAGQYENLDDFEKDGRHDYYGGELNKLDTQISHYKGLIAKYQGGEEKTEMTRMNEDVYWPKEKQRVNHEKNVQQIAEELVDEEVGLDAAFVAVHKFEGKLYVGTNDKKRVSGYPSDMKKKFEESWRATATELIDRLDRDGYKFELHSANEFGFQLYTSQNLNESKKKTIKEDGNWEREQDLKQLQKDSDRIYKLGRLAYRQGKKFEDNPYKGTGDSDCWVDGWKSAQNNLVESYKAGTTIKYNKAGKEYTGDIKEVVPSGKYLVNNHIVSDAEVIAEIPKERKKPERGIPYGKIAEWEQAIKDLNKEKKELSFDQEFEAGDDVDAFERSGRHNHYGGEFNKIEQKIKKYKALINKYQPDRYKKSNENLTYEQAVALSRKTFGESKNNVFKKGRTIKENKMLKESSKIEFFKYEDDDVVTTIKDIMSKNFKNITLEEILVNGDSFYNIKLSYEIEEDLNRLEFIRVNIAAAMQKFRQEFMTKVSEVLPVTNVKVGPYNVVKGDSKVTFNCTMLLSNTNVRDWVTGIRKEFKPGK